jgi:hypothetical protein
LCSSTPPFEADRQQEIERQELRRGLRNLEIRPHQHRQDPEKEKQDGRIREVSRAAASDPSARHRHWPQRIVPLATRSSIRAWISERLRHSAALIGNSETQLTGRNYPQACDSAAESPALGTSRTEVHEFSNTIVPSANSAS